MDMPDARVDIVILNWNGFTDTAACLESIRGLSYPHYRVWVVDNASANEEAERLQREYPEAGVLALKENKGFCGGCNEGMKKALETGADFILLLNNDTLVTTSLLDDLLAGYRSLKDPGALSPLIMHYPETDKIWFSEASWDWHFGRGEVGFQLTNGKDEESLRKRGPYRSEFACGCCLLVATKLVKEIGLFDERYFAFFDEAEWCARMRKKGYPSYVIPAAKMYHKVGGTTPSLVMAYLMSRNAHLWIREHLSFSRKLTTLPVIWKNILWHWLNVKGWIPERKRHQGKHYSQVVLKGYSDFKRNRFGKWDEDTARLIFQQTRTS